MGYLNEIEGRIADELRTGPKTTRQIADNLKINWVTANKYLSYLESFGIVVSQEDVRKYYYLKQKGNYFNLPLTMEQESKINKIYQIISETKVTKTQAQKILFEVNKKLNLNLPIGWYQFGPMTIKPYEDINYPSTYEFNKHQINTIKETTEEYAKLDNFEVEDKIYEQEKNELYKKRKQIISKKFGENINIELMDFLKLVPKEAKSLTEDFVRATLLIGWNSKTKETFDHLWKIIAKINFKNSIKHYYEYDIDIYFQNLEKEKEELHLIITNLVRRHMDLKHSQENKFEAWKN